MKTDRMPLEYDDPVVAVFLRTLAWEFYKAKRQKIPVNDQAKNLVQAARRDLGLRITKGGAPHAFIQSLRRPENGFLSSGRPDPVEKEWGEESAWRLLNLPSHRFVRMLSHDPVHEEVTTEKGGFLQFSVSLRGAAVPKLLVTIGKARPTEDLFGNATRGLYFLREPEGLYVGQSDEFQIRWTDHQARRTFDWWVFVGPEENNEQFSFDTLYAAESLLISFWTEICHTTNRTRGKDKEPVFAYLQPAILLVEAASAVLLWLIREKKDKGFDPWNLPFKDCQADFWHNCYLEPFNKEAD